MEDLRLGRAADRGARQRELGREQAEQERFLARELTAQQLQLDTHRWQAELEQKKGLVELERERGRIERERLDGLSALGVDLTAVLVAECKLPDKTLKVENGDGVTALHLHE